jgi:hypothetical protein
MQTRAAAAESRASHTNTNIITTTNTLLTPTR